MVYYTIYENRTGCSETSALKIQTPGNCPKEEYNIRNTSKVLNQEFISSVIFNSPNGNIRNEAIS